MGKHDKPDDNDGGSLPGQPWSPSQDPPSPDGSAPEGDGVRRK
jgi:hypothetical protein